MISPDAAKIGQWLDAVIPDNAEGYLHGARGVDGHFTSSGRYEFRGGWHPWSYHWPTQRGDAITFMADHARQDDVFCCAYLMQTGGLKDGRSKTNAVVRQIAHSDVDGGLDLYDEVIDRDNVAIVASGTDDHCHVFIQLADVATEQQHDALEEALAKRLGGDSKVRSSDVLRPCGTVNHKGRARGGVSTLVDFIREPKANARKLKTRVLAAELGVDFANIATTNGSPADTQPTDVDGDEAPEPVDMSRYSWIQEALDEPHPDRSTHISHVVRECYDAGLKRAQTRWVVNRRADLVAKLAELGHRDDVLINWNKTAAEWPHPQTRMAAQIAAIVAGLPKAKAKRTFVDGATFILDIPSTIPALWGEDSDVLWAEGESLMIAAPLGLGKTTLGGLLLRAQLGIGPATLLGYPVPARTGKILLLAMDRPAQVARALSRQFTTAERQILADRLVVWKGPPRKGCGPQPRTACRDGRRCRGRNPPPRLGQGRRARAVRRRGRRRIQPGAAASAHRGRAAVRAAPHRQAQPEGRGAGVGCRHLRLGVDHQRDRFDHPADR